MNLEIIEKVINEDDFKLRSKLNSQTMFPEPNKDPNVYRPLLISVSGGTASGKTTVCRQVLKRLGCRRVQVISMDSFYRPLTLKEHENIADYNFDHPNAFDWDLYRDTIRKISLGYVVKIPHYCFRRHMRTKEVTVFYPGDVVMCEGILSLYDPLLRKIFGLKLFVSCDADIRLCRRICRDISERGRSIEGVLLQYKKTVKPSFDMFCAPTQHFADIIIPHGGQNHIAIDLLTTHIRTELHFRHPSFSLTCEASISSKLKCLKQDQIIFENIRGLLRNHNFISLGKLIFPPYFDLIQSKIITTLRKNRAEDVCIVCLVPNIVIQSLANQLGIDCFSVVDPLVLFDHNNVKTDISMENQVKNLEKIKRRISTTMFLFVIDSITFSGNRVRSILIWLKKQRSLTKAICINMISSSLGLQLLAHSFRKTKFYTQLQIEELDHYTDLQAEAKLTRTLVNQTLNDVIYR